MLQVLHTHVDSKTPSLQNQFPILIIAIIQYATNGTRSKVPCIILHCMCGVTK